MNVFIWPHIRQWGVGVSGDCWRNVHGLPGGVPHGSLIDGNSAQFLSVSTSPLSSPALAVPSSPSSFTLTIYPGSPHYTVT